ncbi:M48 family metalloprotease [Natronorubrum thiooxidans]|uniref:Heat shock protein HtpX n=1 Tax=Natronorubrum thiooxidans TaxID=308853 RepID=A0A1N7D9R6_9EURY|nr:M48 family metalloprotease [Natronorubrum thiooxidans]SIR72579.1 heat shock protein HtpX [Natronorubrum thiooxidans]
MSPSRSLRLQMVVSIGLLVGLTLGFLLGIWLVSYGLLELLETGALEVVTVGSAALLTVAVVAGSGRLEALLAFPVVWLAIYALAVFTAPSSWVLATVGSASLLAAIATLEYRQVGTIERLGGAVPIEPDDAPYVHRTATRVATLYDVPVPTIAVSEREAPEAMAVGLRPGNIHLVLSLGTLRALSDDELEAVIAHELAHVANRDAIVMTAASVPVVLAEGIRTHLDDDSSGTGVVVTVPLVVVAGATALLGRVVTAGLSRTRERAADRAAAEATGSPAALASALRTLDERIDETPSRDLRAVSSVSSLSILSLEDDTVEKLMLGPDGDVEPSYWWLRKRLQRLSNWLVRTHPPTTARLESLRALEDKYR